MKPRAIVWDLFGDHLRYHGGAVPMQALSELLDVFGIGESTTRVVLSRMRREGWFTTPREGRQTGYALTDRSSGCSTRAGPGSSTAAVSLGRHLAHGDLRRAEENRGDRDRVRRTLAWHGFGPLAAATWISPHPRLDAVARAVPVRHPDRPAHLRR